MSEPLSISEAASIAGRCIERLEPGFQKPSMDELRDVSLGYGWVKADGLIISPEDFETIERLIHCIEFAHRNIKRLLVWSTPDHVVGETHVIVGFQFAIMWDGEDFLETNVATALRICGRMLFRKKLESEK